MNLKSSLIIACIVSLLLLTSWEVYLRSTKRSIALIDDNKDLWAVQRAKVKNLTDQDVILTGSSRVLFDIQIDKWEEKTGIRPIQLASAGSSPLPIFNDLVNNTDFKGTIVVGVTPGLFFSTTFPEAEPWKWPLTKVEHFKTRTYANRLNHALSLPLQKSFYFISAEEEETDDNVDLRSLLSRVTIGDRAPNPFPPFHQFNHLTTDRVVRMTELAATDTAFANSIKKAWKFFTSDPDAKPDKESTMAYFLKDAKIFKERGGNLILVRCPSTGYFKDLETRFLSRKEYWDVLVDSSKASAYHYEDYKSLAGFDCPEWSHLSAPDADTFTTNLIAILLKDQAITNLKNN